MKDAGVDFVTTCMDTNGVVTLAKEMEKQGLDAAQYLPNGYDHEFLEEYGDLFEGSIVRTDFVPFELPEDDQPEGLKRVPRVDGEGGQGADRELAWPAGSTPTCSSTASRRPGRTSTARR